MGTETLSTGVCQGYKKCLIASVPGCILLSILVVSGFKNIFINSNVTHLINKRNAEILQLFDPLFILGGYIEYFFCRTVLKDFFV